MRRPPHRRRDSSPVLSVISGCQFLTEGLLAISAEASSEFQTAAVVDDILGLQASRLVRQWFTGVQEWVFASHRGGNQYQHAVPASGLPSWFCRDFESLASASCLYSVVLGKHLPCGRANGFAPHWPCFPSAAQRSPLLFSGKKMNHCPICGKLGGQRGFLRHMTPLPKVRDL